MFNYFKTWLGLHLGNNRGQGMIEYVLLVALIALVVVVALTVLGPVIANQFNNVSDKL